MIIVTCANSDVAKDHKGNPRYQDSFRFGRVISTTASNAKRFGYGVEIYDLGELGMGTPYRVEDKHFVTMGHYKREAIGGYKSKSLFKPALMKECLQKNRQLTAYLDGDAELRRPIEGVISEDYDIGVTLRDRSEMETEWYNEHQTIVKYLNAGVIFFNNTDAAFDFIDRWEKLTEEVGNDQMALNRLACPDHYPEPDSVHIIDNVRIKYFPCVKYNYYYFYDLLPSRASIMHFKGDVRSNYPFTWSKYWASMIYIPFKNLARRILRVGRQDAGSAAS
jgi:Nucleotide-diphospho-sugar transferase